MFHETLRSTAMIFTLALTAALLPSVTVMEVGPVTTGPVASFIR